MYVNYKYLPWIIIDLSDGLYELQGTGKTWLCKSLRNMYKHGEKVLGYSYSDYQAGIDLAELLDKNPDLDVVMIDRYIMFDDKYEDEIIKYSQHCIVLMDDKTRNYCPEYVLINIQRDKICVLDSFYI